MVITGWNDHPHFGGGWHERERDGRIGVPYRSANGCGVINLRRGPTARSLMVLMSGPRGLATDALVGRVLVDGEAHACRLDVDSWVLRTFPLPPLDAKDAVLSVVFELDGPPRADDTLHNGDYRPLGWYVSAVWLE